MMAIDNEEDKTIKRKHKSELSEAKKERKMKSKESKTDGTPEVGDEGEQMKKKKKHRKEKKTASEDATIPDSETVELTEKKKKKRKHDDDPGPSTSQEKKKRRKHLELDAAPSAQDSPSNPDEQTDISSHPSKEKKKRRKALEPADQTPVGSRPPAPSPAEIESFLSQHSIKIHSPDHISLPPPVLSFDQLDIPSGLKSAIAGFKEPTPIQACTWPSALSGSDVVGIAETGSGKTLAFGLPALVHLISKQSKPGVSVLVLAPTRELAIQTHETLFSLGSPFGLASVALFGGVDKGPQIKTLRNANKDGKTTRIVVGTPGRILDLTNDGVCDFSGVDYLVLDEADRMLDKGFENDIRSIISYTKQGLERQTLMFSATWPESVRRLASSFQNDPVRVTVGSDELTANSKVEQVVEVFDDPRSKDNRLLVTLRSESHHKNIEAGSDESRILVFALYKKEASRVESMLRRQGYSVGALHGDLSQSARMEALQNFKDGKTGLLVATDVAARGLDIPNVGVVINYTFPLTIEDYIHRIGRTGRGGRSGKSVTYFTGEAHERALAGELARVLRESGFEAEGLKKFPMTIKKKTHGAYGAFFRDDIPAPAAPTKIKF